MRRETTRIGYFGALAVMLAAILLAGMEPARAAFPGTNGNISFTRNGDVSTMDANGDDETNRSNNGSTISDSTSAVSPDGTRIAFRSSRDGKGEIYIMNADGSGQTRLTNAGSPVSDNDAPSFSPDGTKVVFNRTVSGSPSANTDVFVMDAVPESATNIPVRLTDATGRDEEPVFSPNGQKIAFTSNRDGNNEIYVMDANGDNEANLSNNAAGTGSDRFANFSPDGTKISFASTRDGNAEVYSMDTNPSTNDAVRLTDNAAFDQQPAFSPDGTKIVFESGRDGGANIHVMDTDPNTPDTGANVATFATGASQPDWGPADTDPPETTITGGASGPFDGTSTNFTFTSTEGGGTFQCKLDTAAFAPCTSPHLVSPLSEGAHTFQVKAIDASGNEDTSPATRSFTVDTIDPNTAITGGPSGPTNDDSPSFTFTSGETNSTFECRLDSDPFADCPSPKNFTNLDDGEYTFEARAVDAAGNEDSTPASRSFTVDTTAPETTINTAPPATTNQTSADFTFSSESGADFRCSLDDAAFAECDSPENLTVAEGGHTFRVKARDALGNEDATSAEHVWSVDLTPPDTAIISGPAGSVNSGAASFIFASESGSTFECSLDGSPFGGCSSPQSFNVGEGEHTFEIRATDAAGNVESDPTARTWTVDATNPSITPVSPRPNTSSFRRTQNIQATVTDGLDELAIGDIKLFVDGKAKVFAYDGGTNRLAFTARNLTFRRHTIKITATDAAGNTSTRQWSFTVKKKRR